VELFAVSDIEAALNRTRTGQARYRVVLDYLT
jgi:D-arabinose 1-dehydrogenase-like Zn-dependent alcohol dehydrogenase